MTERQPIVQVGEHVETVLGGATLVEIRRPEPGRKGLIPLIYVVALGRPTFRPGGWPYEYCTFDGSSLARHNPQQYFPRDPAELPS